MNLGTVETQLVPGYALVVTVVRGPDVFDEEGALKGDQVALRHRNLILVRP